MMKRAGILFPISVLPNQYGIGDFGKEAYELVDKLHHANVKIWQILPLNPLGYGNSPYQPLSSQAGDEIFISIDLLVEEGLLTKEEAHSFLNDSKTVQYEKVRVYKNELFKKAFLRFEKNDDYHHFIQTNSWVKDYATFRVFKSYNNNEAWTYWKEEFKFYPKKPFDLIPFINDIEFHIFLQYHFYKQWLALKQYANQHNIIIIGDMPIYVGLDSVDVWQNQESFLLEKDGTPSFVAGVPPDYFSKTGQRWGNPIYDWDYLKENNFKFWVDRMKATNKMYDTVRIDHFRAFDTFWKIPASEPTAIIGKWVEAPGYQLFDTLFKEIPSLNVLAEDLGELREEVYELRDHYHLKGMYVFQFHRHEEFEFDKVVVYTGTHDNDTIVSWLETLDKKQMTKLTTLLKGYNEKDLYQQIIHYCLDLDADDVIVPVWDMMGLGSYARFNVPGVIGSPNWEFKLAHFKAFDVYLSDYARMIKKSQR